MNALTTPLAQEMAAIIAAEGPLSLDRFMALALGHPRHGYYMTRDPFGAGGDFITAPEISQIFGELLGLALAITWQNMGAPEGVVVAELGPGRGTLMSDALRAARAIPAFAETLEPHFVEISPVLMRAQAARLAQDGRDANWHANIDSLPEDRPLLILANEFFDALPVRQFQRAGNHWHERLVGLDPAGGLAVGLAQEPAANIPFAAPEGAIFETSPLSLDIMRRLGERIARQGGAMIAIDYGHAKSGFGDTLQAVKAHRFVPVLTDPGEVDITAHVDFAMLAIAAQRGGALAHPLLTQASLLERLGIHHRAEILKRKAENPAEIDRAVARLAGTDDAAMGLLFKAIAITAPGMAPPPGFEQPDPRLS
ncbi:MAG: SAM-dependent methyltransferase [Hyphomicrobiales bacterium]|nr:SAM-dependent methyltransferase [Methylobacterium sp.]MCA3638731.1 SAM-dependent methyltransferase [Methylobacterium sp.]MCE2933318.1 SAM-dependent methyltransferase [Hyphomicrobiales bacterium]